MYPVEFKVGTVFNLGNDSRYKIVKKNYHFVWVEFSYVIDGEIITVVKRRKPKNAFKDNGIFESSTFTKSIKIYDMEFYACDFS